MHEFNTDMIDDEDEACFVCSDQKYHGETFEFALGFALEMHRPTLLILLTRKGSAEGVK